MAAPILSAEVIDLGWLARVRPKKRDEEAATAVPSILLTPAGPGVGLAGSF